MMHQTVELWDEEKLVYVRHSGTATREGSLRFLESLRALAILSGAHSFITDQRALNVDQFTANDTEWLVREAVTHRSSFTHRKHAILVATPLAFGIARMFELRIRGLTSHELNVFDDWGDCLNWLSIFKPLKDPVTNTDRRPPLR